MIRMRRMLCLLAGSLLLLSTLLSQGVTQAAAAGPAAPVSLNENPGFESGSLTPWTTQNNALVTTDHVHTGSYAVNLGGAYSGVEQTVAGLKPNTSYTLTAWVQTEGDLIYMGAKNFAGSGSEVNTKTTSAEYTRLTVSFTTDNATTSAYIFLWKGTDTGASYADDFTLTETPVLTYSGQDVGFNTQDPYFQTPASLNRLYDQVAVTGTKWVRATLFWDLMEPTKGKIDWKQADMIFNTIKAKGLNYNMVIRSAPSWAAGGADTSVHNYAPVDNNSYGVICYEIAKRYLNRGVNITFELGNEENMQFFNMPYVDPAAYTKNMLIPGATGIRLAAKRLDIKAPVILVGGFAPVEPAYVPNSVRPLDFMKAIYENGGQGYFDSIAYHPYTYVSAPTIGHWTFTELQYIIDLMNSKGDTDRKIWATEAGWATGTGSGEVSESDQAAFTGQLFDLWFSLPYAGPLIWYELIDNVSYDNDNRENTFGLLRSGDTSAKPAYQTLLSKIAPVKVSVTGISIDIKHLKMSISDPAIQLTATVSPIGATDPSFTWTSDNPNVAVVSNDGYVTAVGPGTAAITVKTVDGGYQDSIDVQVKREK
jgi:hypothetical protein